MRQTFPRLFSLLILSAFLTVSCTPLAADQNQPDNTSEHTQTSANLQASQSDSQPVQVKAPTATPTPMPQLFSEPVVYGPDQANFPDNINPLTGQPVTDPALLKRPALLVSITNFPPQARPQAGLSFTPWVFEYMIGEGTDRFMGVFYGQFPYPENPLTGGCKVRNDPFVQDRLILGNRVWLDKNEDGIQSPNEPGVGGVCVNLYDSSGTLIQTTSTDSNGYYGFNVEPGTYSLKFTDTNGLAFTEPNVGYENADSDADQTTGRTEAITMDTDVRLWDAGLLPPSNPNPDGEVDLPPAVVGPVRSARLINIYIQNFFQDSCLIFAGATEEIINLIPKCALVFKKGDGGVGSMLDIERMKKISDENAARSEIQLNYTGNLFAEEVPSGGTPATQLDLFYGVLNQNKWVYDPLYQGWLRYVDNTSEDTEFHADTDRLNGRQLKFDNLIVLYVEHELIKPLIIDMYLQQGEAGHGVLFRDGQKYDLNWSTRSGDYEKKTGLRRPIAFTDTDGNPIALRPGHTWIVVTTPYSTLNEIEFGHWYLRIYAPPGTGNY